MGFFLEKTLNLTTTKEIKKWIKTTNTEYIGNLKKYWFIVEHLVSQPHNINVRKLIAAHLCFYRKNKLFSAVFIEKSINLKRSMAKILLMRWVFFLFYTE